MKIIVTAEVEHQGKQLADTLRKMGHLVSFGPADLRIHVYCACCHRVAGEGTLCFAENCHREGEPVPLIFMRGGNNNGYHNYFIPGSINIESSEEDIAKFLESAMEKARAETLRWRIFTNQPLHNE